MTVEEETDDSNSETTNEAAEDTDLEQASTEPEESLSGKEMADIGNDDTNTERISSQTQNIYMTVN